LDINAVEIDIAAGLFDQPQNWVRPIVVLPQPVFANPDPWSCRADES
jgi:hypothetical protein